MNPNMEKPPEDEPGKPEGQSPAGGETIGAAGLEQESVGPKTPEQMDALSEAVRKAEEEAEKEREMAATKEAGTEKLVGILKEAREELGTEDESGKGAPLETGSPIQMAFKNAISQKKRVAMENGEQVVNPGNPHTKEDVVNDLGRMGVIRKEEEPPQDEWITKKTKETNSQIADLKSLSGKRKLTGQERGTLEELKKTRVKIEGGWKETDFKLEEKTSELRRATKKGNRDEIKKIEAELEALKDELSTPEEREENKKRAEELKKGGRAEKRGAEKERAEKKEEPGEKKAEAKRTITKDGAELLVSVNTGEAIPTFITRNFKRILIENDFPKDKLSKITPEEGVNFLKGLMPLAEKQIGGDESKKTAKAEKPRVSYAEFEKTIKEGGEIAGTAPEFVPEYIPRERSSGEEELKEMVKGENVVKEKTQPMAEGTAPEAREKELSTRAKIAFALKDRGLIENLPETERERVEKMVQTLGEQSAEREKKAKEGGWLDPIRATGEWFRSKPLKTKVAIGLSITALALTAGAGSAGIGSLIWAGGVGWRFLGGTASFVGIESYLMGKELAGLKGKEINKKRKLFITAEALGYSVVAGLFLGQAFNNIVSGELSGAIRGLLGIGERGATEAIREGAKQGVSGVMKTAGATGGASPQTDTVMPTPPMEAAAGAVMPYYEVAEGDNLYKIIKANFPNIEDKLPPGGRQTNAIENILADIRKNPADFGITDPDKLDVGDKINLEKIRETIENKTVGGESIVEHAQKLGEKTVQRIELYVPPVEAVPTGEMVDLSKDSPFAGTPDTGLSDELAADAPLKESPIDQSRIESVLPFFDNPETTPEVFGGEDVTALRTARTAMYEKLDQFFGRKGFLFVPGASGVESSWWNSYKRMTFDALMAEKAEGGPVVGFADYVKELSSKVGIKAETNETIEHYLKRALFYVARATKVEEVARENPLIIEE